MRYAMQFDQWLRGAAQTDILASQPAFLCKDAASRNPDAAGASSMGAHTDRHNRCGQGGDEQQTCGYLEDGA